MVVEEEFQGKEEEEWESKQKEREIGKKREEGKISVRQKERI